jgi:hypothetical protein
MNRSGIKRGLAVSAVSALALAGLGFAPAQAATVAGGQPALQLYSQEIGGISTANDGQNTTVTLFAGAPTLIGGVKVNHFRFYYTDGGVDTQIGVINASDPTEVSGGIGTIEWTNPPSGIGSVDSVTVQARDINNVVLASDTNVVDNENNHPVNDAVSLDGALRSEIGVYEGAGIFTGQSTGVLDTDVQVVGPVAAGNNPTVTVAGPTVAGLTPWAAIATVVGNDTGDASDEVVVRADVEDGSASESDDVNAYTLYNQTPTNVTATVAPGDSRYVGQVGDQDTEWLITVTDQKGKPVHGVDVWESRTDGTPYAAGVGSEGGDDTDAFGQVDTTLDEANMDSLLAPFIDQDPASDIQATYYTVDLNNDGNYDNGIDKIVRVDQTNLPQNANGIALKSSLGPAIDDDETTQVTATITDAGGNPIADLTPTVQVTEENITDGTADVYNVPAADTNANGETTFPVGGGDNGDQVNYNVKVTTNTGALGQIAIESDNASAIWDDEPTAQALAGTDTTEAGVLALPSGSILAGRNIAITLTQSPDTNGPAAGGLLGNAILSPQAEQPAGTIRGGDLIASATTSATGTFAVKVDDPALPNGEELNDILTAAPTGLGGDAVSALDLDWLRSVTPVRVNIYQGTGTSDTDGLPSGFGGALRPGGLGLANVRAYNSDDVELSDVDVSMTIDQGFFVDPTDPFEATPAPGAPVDFKSAGKSITVNTGGSDDGEMLVNIERNTGFDDNGLVSDKLRASVASVNDTHDFTWSTQNVPLNPRATDPLVVALSADQDSSILPKARAGDTEYNLAPGDGSGQVVSYDVSAYDQFGNPVEQDIDVTDDTPVADFDHPNGDDSQYKLSQPAIDAYADSATTQSLEVELDQAVKTVYVDDVSTSAFDPTDPDGVTAVQPVDIEQSTAAINWYDLDLSASEFSLGQQGPNTVPVGTSVTEILTAVDNEGQYIEGLTVDFLRSGPGTEDDDSCAEDLDNGCALTNAKGKAYLDFSGGAKGAANVSAVVFEDDGTRFGKVAEDTVRFGGIVKKKINPSIKGTNNGGSDDRIKVRAKLANGATVQLYKLSNGQRTLVQTKKMNENGVVVFSAPDLNGAGATVYKAVVRATGDTQRAATQRKVIR